MKNLSGKVAFITGSAGGIGLGIARAAANEGMNIVLSDIDVATMQEATVELGSRGADVMSIALDVADRGDWIRAVQSVTNEIGPVQLLVNNAGVSTNGMRFGEISPELWDRVMAINLTSVFNGVHYFLDSMKTSGEGHIVNTASVGGLMGFAALSPYSATKAGVIAFSEALRAELSDENIGVSVLCPGGVQSRLWRTSRRVRGLPDTDIPPSDISGQSASPNAMSAYEVGLRVIAGVKMNEPYIFTHPEFREIVTQRASQMQQGFDQAAAFTMA